MISCSTSLQANVVPRGARLLMRHTCVLMALFLLYGTGGHVDLCSYLVGSRIDRIGHVMCMLTSTFNLDCCRRPGTDACKSQETLQQVVTQADHSVEAPITSKLYVGGMCCPSEVPIVRSALGNLQGVIKVSNAVVHRETVLTSSASCAICMVASCVQSVKRICADKQGPREPCRAPTNILMLGRRWIA